MTDEEKATLAVIEQKVDGINHRLDGMNGTVAKTKGRLREVEDYILIQKSRSKTKAWLLDNSVGILSSIISSIAVILLVWKFS